MADKIESSDLAELTALHQEWEDALAAMIARGHTPRDASESMLTIAVTGKMKAEGARETARSLVLVGKMISDAADQQEAADAAAPRH